MQSVFTNIKFWFKLSHSKSFQQRKIQSKTKFSASSTAFPSFVNNMLLAENLLHHFLLGLPIFKKIGYIPLEWNVKLASMDCNEKTLKKCNQTYPVAVLVVSILIAQLWVAGKSLQTSDRLQCIFYLVAYITMFYSQYNLTKNKRLVLNSERFYIHLNLCIYSFLYFRWQEMGLLLNHALSFEKHQNSE